MGEVSALILAAGRSTRFGKKDKLREQIDGKPILSHVIDRVLSAGPDRCFVVVPAGDQDLIDLCTPYSITIVSCADAFLGMGHSLRAGVKAAPTHHRLLVCLGDMPFVATETMRVLMAAVRRSDHENAIIFPVHKNRRGHPAAFGANHRESLLSLSGDSGAASLITANPAQCQRVPVIDPGIHRDIDRPEDLAGSADHRLDGTAWWIRTTDL
ncbi:MAG: nucleotidyltransferase family protein [Pseudomonadota bacterium]